MECLNHEDKKKKDWTIIKKFLKIFSLLIIIFTVIFFTFLGCFLVLNDSTSLVAETVTLSSVGPAYEAFPHSLGKYQLSVEKKGDSLAVYNWYRNEDREDRFLMYNKLGNLNKNVM